MTEERQQLCWFCGAQTYVFVLRKPGQLVGSEVLGTHDDPRTRQQCSAAGFGAPPRQYHPGERGAERAIRAL